MTGSYLAGVARRAAPGRQALLPPVTPWGMDARQTVDGPVAPQAVSPTPPAAAPSPDPAEQARPGGRRQAASRARAARPVVARLATVEEWAEPAEPPAASPSPAEPLPADGIESAPFERVGIARTEGEDRAPEVAASAERFRPGKRGVEVRPGEPVNVPELPRMRSSRRPVEARPPAPPSIRIESIEVVVERTAAQAPPGAPPVERRQAPVATSAPPAPLARGFSSPLGLRQG